MSTRSPNDFEAPPNMDDFLGGPNRDQRSAEMHASLMQWLTESDDMRKTAKSSLKQSIYAGGGAFAGSFIGGPVGGLIGGVAGSIVGFLKSDDYDGLLLAVSKIDDVHRTKLVQVSVSKVQSESVPAAHLVALVSNIFHLCISAITPTSSENICHY